MTGGGDGPPKFKKYILLYIYVLILAFFPFNNIINSFKSSVILTNFFIIFSQTVFVANSY